MTKNKKTSNMPQPAFNQEFKDTAIKLALAGDKPISQVATELGIPVKNLYNWLSVWKETRGQQYCQKFSHQLVVRRGVAQAPKAQSRA